MIGNHDTLAMAGNTLQTGDTIDDIRQGMIPNTTQSDDCRISIGRIGW
jgi:hypothetical protein